MKRIFFLMAAGTAIYYVYQNRYRLMNSVLGNAFLRRLLVGSVMTVPGVRNKIMKSVFSGTSKS